MINFVVCDDEVHIRRLIKGYIERLGKELQETTETYEFSSGQALLANYPSHVDILLLDIKMGEPDGMETARRIRAFAPDVCIIFITSMVQYALKGYQVRAFSFIQKPIPYSEFRSEVMAAITKIRQECSNYFLVPDVEKGIQHQINLNQVLYFEVCNHSITIHMEQSSLNCRGQLKNLEKELGKYGFFRCHASYLVNQRHIRSIAPDQLFLSDNTCIPISKQRRKYFLSDLTNYVGARL